jgi:primosomal replication protein N
MGEMQNTICLCGRALAEPVFSHENHGERFYSFPLSVQRLSGQTDEVNILATESHFSSLLPLRGRRLALEGVLRSFNNKSGQGSKLVISVLCRSLSLSSQPDSNHVSLSGVICKPPILRRTPLGRCICDVMLAVNRRYGRSDYIPCIAWGQVAATAGALPVGTTISLTGRFQSRRYTKTSEQGSETRTAFEVSIMQLEEFVL